MTKRLQKLDGRLINLLVGGSLSVPRAEAPMRHWIYVRVRHWRRTEPTFALSVSMRRDDDTMTIRRTG